MTQCLNCEIPVMPQQAYCMGCGQKTQLKRLSLHEVTHEAIHYFTHADKSIFSLLKQLLVNNGKVGKEYIAGKRKKYFPPLNFFLIVGTVFVLIISVVNKPAENIINNYPELNHISDPVQREKVSNIYQRRDTAIGFMNKYSNVVAMIALPLICFIYWLFYVKGKYNYTEHLVGCLYMVGFTNLLYATIFVPVTLIIGINSSGISVTPILIFMLFQVIYNSIYYFHFMGKYTRGAAFKATAVSIFATAFWYVISASLVSLYIYNAFWGILE